ncbi:hypothetical protein [Primorskyibacter sp. S187A]|uniref:hypothetical protein n=1 Tax=Primorskyibacter sp. S187A TaxID=3415130 RepID=UPI003C7A68A6
MKTSMFDKEIKWCVNPQQNFDLHDSKNAFRPRLDRSETSRRKQKADENPNCFYLFDNGGGSGIYPQSASP